MGSWRKLAWLALGLALCCIPPSLQAQGESHTFRFAFPDPRVTPTLALRLGYGPAGGVSGAAGRATLGDWDVTVAVDAERCEILCVYRRVRSGSPLLPPVAEIQIHTDGETKPMVWVVDPAGSGIPKARERQRPGPDRSSLPAWPARFTTLAHAGHGTWAPCAPKPARPDIRSISNLPLRI